MRFQTTETVETPDTERVIHALEASLRQLSDNIERAGHQITLRGVGPSPRARNYRDTTIFDVVSTNGTTTINADVTFQASALLGASGQDTVVREKLDYAFELMRSQLGLPGNGRANICLGPPAPAMMSFSAMQLEHEGDFSHFEPHLPADGGAGLDHSFAEAAPGGVSVDLVPAPEKFSRVRKRASRAESSAEQLLIESAVEPVVPVVQAEVEPVEPQMEEPGQTAARVAAATEEAIEPRAEASAAPMEQPVSAASLTEQVTLSHRSSSRARVAPSVSDSGARRRAQINQLRSGAHTLRLASAEATKTQLPLLVVVILAVIVAAGSVYLYWAGDLNLTFAKQIISGAPAAEPVAPPAPPVTVTPVPPPPPRHEEANPQVWLEQWADAIRGRDPELQASFYANPVENYLGDSNVSTDSLTTTFRSAIQARDGIWSMKLEKVTVAPKSHDEVLVRLTKHFMQIADSVDESNAQIADRFVKSRMELRRIDGEWKIVSEQDQTSLPAVNH